MVDFPELLDAGLKQESGIFVAASLGSQPLPQHAMQLLASAETDGWRQALETFEPRLAEYVTSEDRLKIIDVLPIESGQSLLEIGPGFGQMSAVIAPRVASLDVIDANEKQARFCQVRFGQQGLKNVRVLAGGSDGKLPYADGSFDGAVMNLVFEWCASRSHRPHEDVQGAFLGEIARVLKPGGWLFLSTKNRFALRLLSGGRDEHMANKRFGSALPRAFGRFIMRGERQEGYLHSYDALRRMMEANQFTVQDSYWAIPDMRWPTELVPYRSSAVANAQRDRTRALGTSPRIHFMMKALPVGVVKHVAPGLTFLVRKHLGYRSSRI